MRCAFVPHSRFCMPLASLVSDRHTPLTLAISNYTDGYGAEEG